VHGVFRTIWREVDAAIALQLSVDGDLDTAVRVRHVLACP
jgi:hypothetical protein